MFKKNDKIKLVQPVIRGKVLNMLIVNDDEIHFMVEYTDTAGEVQQRAFAAEQLEADADAPAEEAPAAE